MVQTALLVVHSSSRHFPSSTTLPSNIPFPPNSIHIPLARLNKDVLPITVSANDTNPAIVIHNNASSGIEFAILFKEIQEINATGGIPSDFCVFQREGRRAGGEQACLVIPILLRFFVFD